MVIRVMRAGKRYRVNVNISQAPTCTPQYNLDCKTASINTLILNDQNHVAYCNTISLCH